ncbi:MAG: glycosyltransferase [Candidatus Eremiobacteraeota bacterium]|nr:glycosyltransferase [Candidatus Eremiobacteraeota bacterium]
MIAASVVIPAFNAERMLGDCLRALDGQSLPASEFEVIVVDDGSTDATGEVARSFGARVIRQPNRGAGAARNAGTRAARGEWVAFTDADCIPARSWLRSLVQAAQTPSGDQVIGVAGKTVGFESRTAAARFCDMVGSLDAGNYLSHPIFPFAPSSNLMYRRALLAQAGGFDERYVSYEACDLHCRITRDHRGPFVYEPRALVFHRHRQTWSEYWRQQYSYGVGYGQFMLHHRDQCNWTLRHELRTWGEIGRLSLSAWRPTHSDDLLYRRGLFVKKFAQHLGFTRARLDPKERSRW